MAKRRRFIFTIASSTFLPMVGIIFPSYFARNVVDAQSTAQKTAVEDILKQIEQHLDTLETQVSRVLTQYPCPDSDCSAECTQLGCGNPSDDFVCEESPDKFLQLDQCGCLPGRWHGYDKATVTTPDQVDIDDAETQAFNCATRHLDSFWKVEHQSHPDRLWLRQIVSSMAGVSRTYPAEIQWRNENDKCEAFNAQFRPWFVTAVSGPKNVVICLDRSGSMGVRDTPSSETRLQVIQPALLALVDTFTAADNIALITFATHADDLRDLLPATAANIEALKRRILQTAFGGGTRFSPPLTNAFSALMRAERVLGNARCKNIIVFFTDGVPHDKTAWLLAVTIGQIALINKAHIFTYTMSRGAIQDIPHDMACSSRGVQSHINTGDDPILVLSSYYRFAEQLEPAVRWTGPYADTYGQGQVLTASKTVVINQEVVAVAAIDVKLTTLWEKAGISAVDQPTVLNWLQGSLGDFDPAHCATVDDVRQGCRLQHLRRQANPPSPCPNGPSASECGTVGQGWNTNTCPEAASSVDVCGAKSPSGSSNTREGACCQAENTKPLDEAECQQCLASCGYNGNCNGPCKETCADTCLVQNCVAGFFSDTNDNSECKRCELGHVSGTGAEKCTPCGPGTYSNAQNSTCLPCPAGFQSLREANQECAPTPEPTSEPTDDPTDVPTHFPTDVPTDIPTDVPTAEPTAEPTFAPCSADEFGSDGDCVPYAIPIVPGVLLCCCCLAVLLCLLRRRSQTRDKLQPKDRNKNNTAFTTLDGAAPSSSDDDDLAAPLQPNTSQSQRKRRASSVVKSSRSSRQDKCDGANDMLKEDTLDDVFGSIDDIGDGGDVFGDVVAESSFNAECSF